MVARLVGRELGYAYGDGPPVVDGFSLELLPGQLVALLGPNGAGKSTLLRLLCGQLQPQRGQALVDGRSLHELRPRERALAIAYVPQALRALPELRVRDFVLGGRYAHGAGIARVRAGDARAVARALEACDAADLGERLLEELSGGQRQRVLLARALAQEAPLLLIDEPTSSLDPEHQLHVFELVARLTGEGRSALVVTHELNLASQFATRLLLMSRGRLEAGGSAAEILRPQVLEPVYGAQLAYGELRGRDGAPRPWVIPWLACASKARPPETRL